MKKTLNKFISVILVLISCFMPVLASAQSDFVDSPTLPPTKEIEISIKYAPLKSKVVIGNFGPLFEGMIIEIIYDDGTSETLRIEKSENGYIAGDYRVFWNYFTTESMPTIISPGINSNVFYVECERKDALYYGSTDFSYLYIPSFTEIIYAASVLFKSLIA